MPTSDVDAVAILAKLAEHLVIGGFAIELWDVAVPPTIDIDITPERSQRNLDRLAQALNDLDAEIRFGDETVAIPGGFTAENLENVVVLNLTTFAGPLDITLTPAGTDGFEDLVRQAQHLEYRGVLVPTADLADVARSKEAAGRAKDIVTLPAIHAHLRSRKR